ncbi:hypothetical protein Tco_1052724 [Tanacetum coccineum]
MVNEIPPDHVDDVPVIEPNQHDDVPVVSEPILVDEDEDPEEEFEEEEEPHEEEDDMEVDIEEDENEPELTYPYEEHEDETVPASVHEVGELSTAPFLREDSDGLYINSLFGWMVSLSRRLCGRETAHALLVEKLGNAEDKVECKKLKKELKEERIMPSKSAPLTQGAIRRMIKESVNAAIAAEFMKCNPTTFHGTEGAVELQRWFEKNESVFGISECAEGKKVKFVAATLQGPALTW